MQPCVQYEDSTQMHWIYSMTYILWSQNLILVGVCIQMNNFSLENSETIQLPQENSLDGKKLKSSNKALVLQNLIHIYMYVIIIGCVEVKKL